MESLLQLFKKLNEKQRKTFIVFVGVFIFILSLFIAISVFNSDSYLSENRELATVDRSDVSKVIKAFEKDQIDITTENKDGKILLSVKESDFKKAHLKISTLDITSSKLLGWKLFEESKLGKSSFDNNINYIRALEEEIQMSINIINSILNSKVKISIPKETLFIDTMSAPKASVIIELKQGMKLNRKQINGIKSFIANSVENLNTKNVELINSLGISLETTEDGGMFTMAQEQMRYKNQVEQKIKNKILANLSPVVGGLSNITAEITIDFDYNKKNSYEEIYDPNSVIRSAKNKNLKMNTSKEDKVLGGVPGVVSNIAKDPSKKNNNASILQDKKEAEDITNFEISKKVINTTKKRYGDILKIGAAITFNTKAFNSKDIERINKQIENIVKSAINFNGERGDIINVEGFEFFTFEKEVTTKDQIEGTIGSIVLFMKTYSIFFKFLFVAFLLVLFYKKFILYVSDIKLLDSDDKYESSEELRLRKVKRDSERKRLLEDQYNDELSAKDEERRMMEKRINDQINSISDLTDEEELKYVTMLKSIKEQTKGKEEEMAHLFENLLEMN